MIIGRPIAVIDGATHTMRYGNIDVIYITRGVDYDAPSWNNGI